MSITARGAYFYNSSQQITKQGSLTYDSDTGKYLYSPDEAEINQGDVSVTQLAMIFANGTFSGGHPVLSYVRDSDGYKSPILSMDSANWTIIELDGYNYKETVATEADLTTITDQEENDYVIVTADSTQSDNKTYYYWDGTSWNYIAGTEYQVFNFTFNYVGLTYKPGTYTVVGAYLMANAYDTFSPAKYTVQDGINVYEELGADYYAEIYAAFDTLIGDLVEKALKYDVNIAGGVSEIITLSTKVPSETKLAEDLATNSTEDQAYTDTEVSEVLDGTKEYSKINIGGCEVTYDDSCRNLEADLGNDVILQIGEENFICATNKSGVSVSSPTVCEIIGSTGNKVTFDIASNDENPTGNIGIATETIANNANGKLTHFGLVRNVDTTAISGSPVEGAVIYLGTNGGITTVKPTAPNTIIRLGNIVTANASVGVIFIDIQRAGQFKNQSDVYFNGGLVDRDIPVYNETNVRWEAINLDTELANLFESVSYATDTHILTFTQHDGSTQSLDLPLESTIVSASYDNTTKDLTFTLQSGSTLVVPLDDIISGLASEDYVDTADSLRVPKDLSSDTPILYSAVPDEDTAFLPVDVGGTFYKINLTNIYTGANVAAGSFSPSGDFSGDGLIANAAINGKIVALTGSSGQYLANIMDITDSYHVVIEMPDTSADTTATTQISFDNGTTYRYLQINGEDIPVASLSGEILHIYRDGSTLKIYVSKGLDYTMTHKATVSSTYGEIAPLNEGTPEIVNFKGLTIKNIVDGENIADGGSVSFDSVSGITYFDSLNEVLITGDGTTKTITNSTGDTVDIMVIPITNTPYASDTASQWALRVPEYIEGETSITNPTVGIVGKNLLDETKGVFGKFRSISNGEVVEDADSFYYNQFIQIKNGVRYKPNNTYGTTYYLKWDYDFNYIGYSVGNSILTDFSGYITLSFVNTGLTELPSNFQLEEGTTATDYVPYHSEQVTYTRKDGNDLVMRSVGTAQDGFTEIDGILYKEANVAVYSVLADNVISLVTTGTYVDYVIVRLPENCITFNTFALDNFNYQDKPQRIGGTWDESSLSAVGSVATYATRDVRVFINKGTYATLAEAQADLAGTILTYELATPDTSVEIEQNGTWYQEEVTTITQLNNIAGELSVKYNLDSTAQILTNANSIRNLQEEHDELEVEVETNISAIGTLTNLTTTEKGSLVGAVNELDSGKVDVDGDKVLSDNNFTDTLKTKLDGIEESATADQTDAEIKTAYENNSDTNAYTDTAKGKVDKLTVTANVDLDKVIEWKAILSSGSSVSSATTAPSSNLTLSESYSNFDWLWIDFYRSGKYYTVKIPTNGFASGRQYIATIADINTGGIYYISFRLERSTDTGFIAYYGAYGTSYTADSTINILEIYGGKL